MTQKCHFIGIGGIGMSGLARILLSKNMPVTGSDISTSYVTEGLVKAGAEVFIGHSAKYVTPETTVIYSTDIKADNPEYVAALQLKCPMLHRSDLLLQLMKDQKTLAIAGTHGKTSTTALLAHTLSVDGLDPSYAVGGIVKKWQANAGHGEGEYFVAEADESDGTFLKYNSFGAVITNIDLDHMNHFGTEKALIESFGQFAKKVKSSKHLLWCGDDVRLQSLNLPGISYGFSVGCAIRALNITQVGWETIFDIEYQGKMYPKIKLALIGKHNVLNALAVFGLALAVNAKEKSIREAFATFEGVARRCDKKGESHKILLLDDYAHHPTEIKTTLAGIRSAIKEKRLIAVFQPHRYSRTQDCLGTYGGIFDIADEVIITDIFAAGEKPIPGLTHEVLMKEIQFQSTIPCRYVPRKDLPQAMAAFLRPHDTMVTLGAGDITQLSGEILNEWKLKAPQKLAIGVVNGGCSVEHEISLLSSKFVVSGLQREIYALYEFGIDKQGKWQNGSAQALSPQQDLMPVEVLQNLMKCDVIVPVLHGTFGEDGTIQGFFEMLGKAYVGCDYRSSAIAMDKATTKKLIQEAGIATSPFVSFTFAQWQIHSELYRQQVIQKLFFPVFVKPVHLGSSVGVKKVEKPADLDAAINDAFRVDTCVLVENGINGREIEFALLGSDEVQVFPPGEIYTDGKVYDYDAKYSDKSMSTNAKVDLPPDQIAAGMELAKRAYMAIGCDGMARVDFFLDESGKFWFNEINPIPGFTKISLYPKMCAANGLEIEDLMDRLIILALHRKRRQQRLIKVI